MNDKNTKLHELQKILEKMGVKNPGQWGESPERTVRLPMVDRQKEALLKLRGVLEGIVEKDRQTVIQLREQINRLKYGGGS